VKPLKPIAWRRRALEKLARERRARYFDVPRLVSDPNVAREEAAALEAVRAPGEATS
jgi:hypothetical protein